MSDRCECIDPDRHGHLDDCPLSEVERLREQITEIPTLCRRYEREIESLRSRLAEADALLREIAGQRQAVAFFVPPLTGVIAALDRIDAHLARQP
jgi:hypothetical protein